MLKLAVFEVPPPGDGLKTVRVALANTVARSAPFQRTTDAAMKPLPLTVRTNAEPPATADAGLTLLRVGAGLGAVTPKLTALEVPPPGEGLKTVTEALPALEMS